MEFSFGFQFREVINTPCIIDQGMFLKAEKQEAQIMHTVCIIPKCIYIWF